MKLRPNGRTKQCRRGCNNTLTDNNCNGSPCVVLKEERKEGRKTYVGDGRRRRRTVKSYDAVASAVDLSDVESSAGEVHFVLLSVPRFESVGPFEERSLLG